MGTCQLTPVHQFSNRPIMMWGATSNATSLCLRWRIRSHGDGADDRRGRPASPGQTALVRAQGHTLIEVRPFLGIYQRYGVRIKANGPAVKVRCRPHPGSDCRLDRRGGAEGHSLFCLNHRSDRHGGDRLHLRRGRISEQGSGRAAHRRSPGMDR